MHLLDLPEELVDEIFDRLFYCPLHPECSRAFPCLDFHAPSHHSRLTPLRGVNRFFADKLSPAIFQHTSCRGKWRHINLPQISQSLTVAPLVRTLKIDVCPRDFGREWSEEIHGYPAGDRARYYFDDLKRYLIPPLSRMRHLQTLYLTTTYAGLHLAGKSRGDLLMPCFEALCVTIREARLSRLETVQIGVPYEGGYAGFFQAKTSRRMLEDIKSGCEEVDGEQEREQPRLRNASVKLSDWQDNYTIMDFMLEE